MRFLSLLLIAGLFFVATPVVTLAQTSASPLPAVQQPPAAPVPDPSSVAVPSGTPVKVSLTDQIASNTAHAGDKIHFKAIEPVVVDGWVIVPSGAVGEGEIISAEGAGGNGHPGKIQIQFNWIYGADDLKIKLSDVPENSNGDGAKGGASTAAIASYLVLGPLGLFAHNFVHGKDVIVNTDQKIQVYVAQTVHIVPKTKLTAADGFAH
jgi:hypothetical protein